MTFSIDEGKALIAINDLRFLNKKFGWQKSLAEIYEQNLLDLNLFESDLKVLKMIIVDVDSRKVGETAEIIDSIHTFWQKFMLMLFRVNTRINIVKMSQHKRGVPVAEIQEFVRIFDSLLNSNVDCAFLDCRLHFYWLQSYLTPKDNSKENLEIVIWNSYSGFLESAKQVGKLSNIPTEKYFEHYGIELKLKEILSSALNEED